MMGRTIKNEINTDRLCDENKISAKMMNDATGIERTASIAGASSSSIRRKCADNAANHVPNIIPTIKPKEKLVLVVTHDTHTALMSHQRIVLRGGAVCSVVTRTDGEAALYKELGEAYHRQLHYQTLLRKGDTLA